MSAFRSSLIKTNVIPDTTNTANVDKEMIKIAIHRLQFVLEVELRGICRSRRIDSASISSSAAALLSCCLCNLGTFFVDAALVLCTIIEIGLVTVIELTC